MATTLFRAGAHIYQPKAVGVEHLAHHCIQAVEEDLGQAPEGENGAELQHAGVQPWVRTEMIGPRKQRGQQGENQASTSSVRLSSRLTKSGAPVALLAGLDDLRHQHHIEHPARQQQVDHVRDGVGLLEDVADRRVGTDGDGQHGGPDEAQETRNHGSGRHDGAGLGRACACAGSGAGIVGLGHRLSMFSPARTA